MSEPGTTESAPRMAASRWLWVALALVGLCLAELSFAGDAELDKSLTSYGKGPRAHGALHDFLSALHADVGRSRASFAALPSSRVLWLLQPNFLDPSASHAATRPSGAPELSMIDELRSFVERGGCAVVFGGPDAVWDELGLARDHSSAGAHPGTESQLGPARRLALPGLARFAAVSDWEVLMRVDGAPFVAKKSLGTGTLVAVADARLFDNEHLALEEHANLAIDLARVYGPPLFDERSHGLGFDRSLFSALGPRRSLSLLSCFALWGLLSVLGARSVPGTLQPQAAGPRPGLSSFVEPLAWLYSREARRDPAAVYRAYLHGLRLQLRRALFGPRGGSDALLDQRLLRDLAHERGLCAELRGQRAPRQLAELEASARRMESYLATVLRGRSRTGG